MPRVLRADLERPLRRALQRIAVQVRGDALLHRQADAVHRVAEAERPADDCRQHQPDTSCSRQRSRGQHAVRAVGDVLDGGPVRIAVARIARVDAAEILDLRLQVREVRVDQHVGHRAEHELAFQAVDVRVDVLVDRGPRDDLRHLQPFVLVVERREVRLHAAAGQHVLRADFQRVDEFRIVDLGRARELHARAIERRIEAAGLVAARIERVQRRVVEPARLPVEAETAGVFVERRFVDAELVELRRRRRHADRHREQHLPVFHALLVVREAHARGHPHRFARVVVQLAEQRARLERGARRGVDVVRRRRVEERRERRGHLRPVVELAGDDVVVGVVVGVEVEHADLEVHRPLELRGQPHFGRPLIRLLVRLVVVAREHTGVADAAGERAEQTGGVDLADRDAAAERRHRRAVVRQTGDRPVVIGLRLEAGLLIAADRRERHRAEVVRKLQRRDGFVGFIGRVVLGEGLVQIRWHRRAGVDVGTGVDQRRRQRKARERAVRRTVAEIEQQRAPLAENAAERAAHVAGLEREPVGQAAERAARIAMAHLLRDARAVRILLVVIDHQRDVGGIARREAQRAARRPLIAVVDVVAGREIVGEAVALEADAGEARGERVPERDVHHAFHFERVVVAGLELDVAVELLLRLARDDVDGAAGGVAPVQRALRPAQHFDTLHVEVFGLEQPRILDRHRVEMRLDAGVAAGRDRRHADAADLEVRAGEVRLRIRDVRHVQLQVGRLVDLAAFERLAAERSDCDRHVDQIFFAPLRRDDDDVDDLRVPGCRRLGVPSTRTSQSSSDGERERSRASHTDVIPRAHL